MTTPTYPLPGLRVLVIGTSGSGKSTFAERLAREAGIAHLELDQMNWRPGWYDRSTEEPEAFLADVAAATSASEWVLAGN
ncbi:MAG: AAA family ATPase [Hyphomonadaceae bacterium]